MQSQCVKTLFLSMSKKRTLHSYFASASTKKPKLAAKNKDAEALALRLGAEAYYLTPDGASWYLLKRKWLTSTEDALQKEWSLHPTNRHKLMIFGRQAEEKRWSQSWGVSYAYSGAVNVARPLKESKMVVQLIDRVNELSRGVAPNKYNGCLQNWYEPSDSIALHSDDERAMCRSCPIFSLSWGGTRRFLFRKRKDKKEKTEIWLRDGDLLVMGGTCQTTHYHEVPKLRKTMDPPTSDRINWTIRAFKDNA